MSINFWRSVYSKVSRRVLASKDIRHFEASLIYSPDDIRPNDFLMDIATLAINKAWRETVEVRNKNFVDSSFYNVFPGEHYRLLKAIAGLLNPASVVEVGTFTGMGCIAIKQGMSAGVLHTYDIVPWNSFESHLEESDFAGGRIKQHLGDLSDPDFFNQHLEILNASQVIFADAPKDGVFEYKFLSELKKLAPMPQRLLILDDIRFVNMTDLWHGIKSPKLDISSFGHWSGTGIVDISQGFLFEA